MKELFDNCNHEWMFHANAENGFAKWSSFLRCKKCEQLITLQEKCALEQTEIANIALQDQKASSLEQLDAQKKSLKVQEDSLNVAKKAMIISAVMMVLGVVWLYLERILK